MGIVLILLFGIALIAGPIAADVAGHSLSTFNSSLMLISGVILSLFAGILLVITKLYRKTQASEAFVRTGMGGFKIIKDGGAIVIPVVHKVVTITLRTMKFELSRMGKQALLTKDKLRADIGAEFFVRVMPDEQSISNAARSFGEHMSPDEVKKLVAEKAVSALRTVAATKTLEELNSEREVYMKEVTKFISQDLAHNGLTLETATISTLDQTSTENYDPNNIFDAEGLATIAMHTELKQTEANQSKRTGEQARKEQDVAARLKILEFDKNEKEAEANQAAEVAVIQAEQQREAQEKQIEAQRQVDLATVQKAQTVEVATQKQQQAVEVADREKQQAVAVADQKKLEAETRATQDVEVAEQAKLQAVAAAETEKATAETAQAQAEAEREKARQSVQTVAIVEEAGRLKQQAIISAQAEAEQSYVRDAKSADAKAYGVKKDAEARKDAADADAEAVRKKAEADRDAKVAEATGEKAIALVPVQVESERVTVAQRNVEQVIKPELEARELHGKVAQDFELAKAQISAEMNIRIETAKAAATIYERVEIKAFATADDVANMTSKMLKGVGLSEQINGLVDGLESDTLTSVVNGISTVKGMLGMIGKKAGISSEELASTAPVVIDKTSEASASETESGNANGVE